MDGNTKNDGATNFTSRFTETETLRAVCVLHALTAEQKEQRLNHAYDLIETIKSDINVLDSIITRDESWYFAYDRETKRQSSKWCGANTPTSKKF